MTVVKEKTITFGINQLFLIYPRKSFGLTYVGVIAGAELGIAGGVIILFRGYVVGLRSDFAGKTDSTAPNRFQLFFVQRRAALFSFIKK